MQLNQPWNWKLNKLPIEVRFFCTDSGNFIVIYPLLCLIQKSWFSRFKLPKKKNTEVASICRTYDSTGPDTRFKSWTISHVNLFVNVLLPSCILFPCQHTVACPQHLQEVCRHCSQLPWSLLVQHTLPHMPVDQLRNCTYTHNISYGCQSSVF